MRGWRSTTLCSTSGGSRSASDGDVRGGAAGKRLRSDAKIMITRAGCPPGIWRSSYVKCWRRRGGWPRSSLSTLGRAVEEVERDIDRDYFMTAREALEYGLIDDIITPRRGVAAADLALAGAAAG